MRRNMDLIRELILKLEAIDFEAGTTVYLDANEPEVAIEGYRADDIDHHLTLLGNAGFLLPSTTRPMIGITFRGLSWEGHDFVDAIRDPIIWAKTKNGAAAAGGFTFELLRDLAKGFIKTQIEQYTAVKF